MIWTRARQFRHEEEVTELGALLAGRLRKPVPADPAEWVPAHISLSREVSPSRPGPYDVHYKPWTLAILRWRRQRPGRKGLVIVKRSQVGLTTAIMALIVKQAAESGGPMLYINGDKETSLYWSKTWLDDVLDHDPMLGALFGDAVDLDEKRETGITRPFRGGRLDFAGGGSAAGLTGKPYVAIVMDEIDLIEENFPAKAGSPWGFGKARTHSVQHEAYLYVFSHPRTPSGGVVKIFRTECNRFAWTFTCPNPECGEPIAPTWSMVRFITGAKGGGEGATVGAYDLEAAVQSGEIQDGVEGAGSGVGGLGIDASMARLHCPHCGRAVEEHERRAAVMSPERGGSGRFEHTGGPTDMDFDGVEINGLCDPDKSVASMAKMWLACRTEKDRRTFLNLECGEVDEERKLAVTVDKVQEAIRASVTGYLLPPPPMGVFPHLAVAGVDVQYRTDDPLFYCSAQAYTGTGTEVILDLQKLRGWASLFDWLASSKFSFDATAAWDPGVRKVTEVGIVGMAIDCAWGTSHVLDNCRRMVVSKVSGAVIDLLPVRFAAHIKSLAPAVMPDKKKRIDPARPHLGEIDLYELHRHTWVGRSMSRWNQPGARIVTCRPPSDLAAHATANVLEPAPDPQGWGVNDLVWTKIDKRRDDYQMAMTYGEVYAALKGGLDSVHELVTRLRGDGTGGRRATASREERDGGGIYDGINTDHW